MQTKAYYGWTPFCLDTKCGHHFGVCGLSTPRHSPNPKIGDLHLAGSVLEIPNFGVWGVPRGRKPTHNFPIHLNRVQRFWAAHAIA